MVFGHGEPNREVHHRPAGDAEGASMVSGDGDRNQTRCTSERMLSGSAASMLSGQQGAGLERLYVVAVRNSRCPAAWAGIKHRDHSEGPRVQTSMVSGQSNRNS